MERSAGPISKPRRAAESEQRTESQQQPPEPVAAFAALARALTGSLELSEVLYRIANEARALSDATGVSILLQRDGFAEFVAHATPPPGSLIPVGFQFEPVHELVEALEERTEPLIIRELHSSPLIPAVIKEQVFINDLVIVPLRTDERLIGVLNLAYNEMPDPLPWDPVLFGALADQAAVAVRNAQLYEAARASNEQLVQSEKLSALGRVIAQVTHELNNPLTTARLLTESLELEALPPGARELVHSLGHELEHAGTIMRDLLLFVHRGATTPSEIEPGDFIRRTIAGVERHLTANDVSLELELDEPLPSCHLDPHALRQVLLNLVTNAIHAVRGRAAERRLQIRAHAERSGPREELLIEVEDNGDGIPPSLLARIFEPFYTTKPIGEGTGLGLTVVKGIVESHGGTIQALHVPSGGTLFRLRLPISPAPTTGTVLADPTPVVTPPAEASPRDHQTPRTLRVLVIDDEPELQRALHLVLTRLGCKVTTALDGESGILYAQEEDFDLVLCDVRLPGLHGPELLDRMRQQTPRAVEALVFITGDTITREIRDFITSSGLPSLTKPFGREQLQRLLDNVRACRG